jgi:uncharacterized protein
MIISILSDSHNYLGSDVLEAVQGSDQIWHAGDVGDPVLLDQLSAICSLKAVYGNIDSSEIRLMAPEDQFFEIEGLKVFITHIAGYPGKYNARVRERITSLRPDVLVCGHSHILKVMRDPKYGHLHINPGACGVHGFHIYRTLIKMQITSGKIHDVQVIEFGKRGIVTTA